MTGYQVSFAEHPAYLYARVVGPRTVENALRYFEEVFAACLRTGLSQVLLEMNLTGPSLGAAGVLHVVNERCGDGAKLRKVAYVESSDVGPSRAKFAETVAVNRAVNIRLFDSVDEAREWLESGT